MRTVYEQKWPRIRYRYCTSLNPYHKKCGRCGVICKQPGVSSESKLLNIQSTLLLNIKRIYGVLKMKQTRILRMRRHFCSRQRVNCCPGIITWRRRGEKSKYWQMFQLWGRLWLLVPSIPWTENSLLGFQRGWRDTICDINRAIYEGVDLVIYAPGERESYYQSGHARVDFCDWDGL